MNWWWKSITSLSESINVRCLAHSKSTRCGVRSYDKWFVIFKSQFVVSIKQHRKEDYNATRNGLNGFVEMKLCLQFTFTMVAANVPTSFSSPAVSRPRAFAEQRPHWKLTANKWDCHFGAAKEDEWQRKGEKWMQTASCRRHLLHFIILALPSRLMNRRCHSR